MFRGFYIWLTLSKIENVSYFVIKHFIYPYQDIRILIKIALRESDSNNLKIENKLSQSEKSHLVQIFVTSWKIHSYKDHNRYMI